MAIGLRFAVGGLPCALRAAHRAVVSGQAWGCGQQLRDRCRARCRARCRRPAGPAVSRRWRAV
eukprot:14568924-Alexandrium_andersonii.AAC.1